MIAGLLDEQTLHDWVVEQRWFASKSREVSALRCLEATEVGEDLDPQLALALVEVRFHPGTHELYHLPLGFRHVDEGWDQSVVLQAGDRTVYDAMADPACARRIVAGPASEIPRKRTLPACTSSAIAPHVSSTGTPESSGQWSW